MKRLRSGGLILAAMLWLTLLPGAVLAEGGSTHVVEPAETLASIANLHGTTVRALATANGLSDPDLIRVGQALSIPARPAPSSPSSNSDSIRDQPELPSPRGGVDAESESVRSPLEEAQAREALTYTVQSG